MPHHHHHQSHRRDSEPPDLNETKAHIFVAGHELLKAAEGVLKFCKAYVEQTSTEKPHPHLVQFFSKAIGVAGDLGSSMIKATPFREMAEKVTKPFCDTIEREMRVKKDAKKPEVRSKEIRKRKKK